MEKLRFPTACPHSALSRPQPRRCRNNNFSERHRLQPVPGLLRHPGRRKSDYGTVRQITGGITRPIARNNTERTPSRRLHRPSRRGVSPARANSRTWRVGSPSLPWACRHPLSRPPRGNNNFSERRLGLLRKVRQITGGITRPIARNNTERTPSRRHRREHGESARCLQACRQLGLSVMTNNNTKGRVRRGATADARSGPPSLVGLDQVLDDPFDLQRIGPGHEAVAIGRRAGSTNRVRTFVATAMLEEYRDRERSRTRAREVRGGRRLGS